MRKTIKLNKRFHVVLTTEVKKICPECGGTKWFETYTGQKCGRCDYQEESKYLDVKRFFGGIVNLIKNLFKK